MLIQSAGFALLGNGTLEGYPQGGNYMAEFQMMNIFFAVAAIGFFVWFVLICIALFYVIKLVRSVERIAETVEEEASAIKEDLDAARASAKRKGFGLLSLLFGFAGRTGARILKKKRRKS